MGKAVILTEAQVRRAIEVERKAKEAKPPSVRKTKPGAVPVASISPGGRSFIDARRQRQGKGRAEVPALGVLEIDKSCSKGGRHWRRHFLAAHGQATREIKAKYGSKKGSRIAYLKRRHEASKLMKKYPEIDWYGPQRDHARAREHDALARSVAAARARK